MTKFESGKRNVSLDEAFAYASVLGVQPFQLMAAPSNTPVEVSPDYVLEGHMFRAWLRGHAWCGLTTSAPCPQKSTMTTGRGGWTCR